MVKQSLLVLLFVSGTLPACAAPGIFALSATSISMRCDESAQCAEVTVRSPDEKGQVRRTFVRDSRNGLNLPTVELITPLGHWPVDTDPEWFGDVDVLWSPDSGMFAMTGGVNGYTESLRVFEVTGSGPKRLRATIQPT